MFIPDCPHYLSVLQEATSRLWDRIALSTLGVEEITFGQMATKMEGFHLFFRRLGLGRDAHIALCGRNGARWGMSFLTVETYGAVIVPILADFTPDSIAFLTDHSDSVGLFTSKDKWPKLDITRMPKIRFVILIDDWSLVYAADEEVSEAYDAIGQMFDEKYPQGYGPDDVSFVSDNMDELAAINYTSGSTGDPKGVMLTYRNFSAVIEVCSGLIPGDEKDTMVSMLPMAHMYGLTIEFLYPISRGIGIYWMGKSPTPSALLSAFQQVKPYLLITVPLVLEKVYKSKIKPMLDKPAMRFALSVPGLREAVYGIIKKRLENSFGGKVQQFIAGGAAFNPDIEAFFKRIKFPFLVGYGMTEGCPLIAYASPGTHRAGSCGRAIASCRVRIDSGDPQKAVGEIQVVGDNICRGYYKNPEATAAAFTPDGWLRTGDLGVVDFEGNIFIKGRSKSMILGPSGQNIYPEEIEAVVNSCEHVVESVVVDRAGKIVALVYLEEGIDAEAVPDAIKVTSNKRLPGYSKIASVEVVDKPFEKTPKMSIKRFLYS